MYKVKKNKRVISTLMVVAIMLTTINFNIFINDNIAYAETILGVEQPSDKSLFWYEAAGITYQIRFPSGITRNTTVKGKGINFEILRDRHILVFGQPFGDKDKNGEYRYLGYTIDGNSYSNKEFINDADSGRKPYEKNIQPLMIVGEENDLQTNLLIKVETIKEVLEEEGFPSSWQDRDDLLNYFLVQGLKGEGTQASIRMYHKTSDGKVWYQTLTKDYPVDDVKPLVMELKADFDLNSKAYEYQTVGFKDKSVANGTEIRNWNLTVINTANGNIVKEFDDKDLAEQELKNGLSEGHYKFELTIDNDEDGADYREDSKVKYITVQKQLPDSEPIGIIEAPSEVKINTTYTVTTKNSVPSYGDKFIKADFYIDGEFYKTVNIDNSPNGYLEIKESYSEEGIHSYYAILHETSGNTVTTNTVSTKIISNVQIDAVAKIDVPDVGYEGYPFDVSTSGSYVTVDGKRYSLAKAVELGYATYKFYGIKKAPGEKLNAYGGKAIVNGTGFKKVFLRIYPKGSDKFARDYDSIEILPVPVADVDIEGDLKENRKVTLNGNASVIHAKYPADKTKTYFKIKEISTGNTVTIRYGESVNNSFIRTKELKSLKLEAIFKKPGEYVIEEFYIEDTRGMNDLLENKKFTIKADKEPYSEFYVKDKFLRDPDTNKAIIEIESKAKSIDNDYIQYKQYHYKFDSNNDGNFADEYWVYAGTTNNINFTFEVSKVGKYLIREKVKESFSSPTIEEFVTDTDRKESYSYKTIEVDNKEPIASFTPIKSKKIDVMINYNEDDKTQFLDSVNIYENDVINDKDALLRPTTYLNSFINVTEDIIPIATGEIYGNDRMGKYDENENYLIFSSEPYYIAVRKKDFNIMGEIPITDNFINYTLHRYNTFVDNEAFLQKYNKLFLGNTNFIWTESKLVNVETMEEITLPVNIDYLKPFIFNKDKYFYYIDTNGILNEFNFNTYNIRQIDIDNMSEYNMIYASDSKLYFIDRNFMISTTDSRAKIKIITTDLNGNILNTTTSYTSLEGYSSEYRIDYHNGLQKVTIDDNNDLLLHLEVRMKDPESDGDHFYKSRFRLVRIDNNGNIKSIKSVGYNNDIRADSFRKKVSEYLDYIIFEKRSDGNFQITSSAHSSDRIRRIVYDELGNTIVNYFRENYNYQRIQNKENERYLLIYGFDGLESKNYYLIIDTYTGEEHYKLYTDGGTFGEYISEIKNSPNEFYYYEDYDISYIINLEKGTQKDYPYILKDYVDYFVKKYDKLYQFGGGSKTKIYKENSNSYSLINTYTFSIGSWDKFLSSDFKYITTYQGEWNPTDYVKYEHVMINPTFFEITEKIKAQEFKNNDKYIVIIEDEYIPYTTVQRDELINTIKSKGAKVIWYGNSNNSTLANYIISQTDGYFRSYSTYSNMMNDLAYILKQDNSDISDRINSIYVKKGETISYNKIFADYENDPQHTASGELWRYIHTPNDDGLASFHNQWLTNPITRFNKDGVYRTTLRLRDNPVESDDRFDIYRKWSSEDNYLDIIVGESDAVQDIPPFINMNITGTLTENHRVDFEISAIQGTNPIDWSSLDIKINSSDYKPYIKPMAQSFSRVFSTSGNKSITVKLSDNKGNESIKTFNFTIENDLPPTSDFNIVGDGQRNEEGYATFKITDNSSSSDDSIGTVEYYIEDTAYKEEADGSYSPNGLTWYPLELNEAGEFELSKVGTNRIKQVVREYYQNGISLDGYDLDQFRIFKTSESIKTTKINNIRPTLEYNVNPSIIIKGEKITHFTNVSDDTPFGDEVEYRFTHNSNYYQNSEGTHNNSGIITTEPLTSPTQKGEYIFEARVKDEDGTYSDWVNGGTVYVVSEPLADFELYTTNGEEYEEDFFKSGSLISIENKAYNEDYKMTIPSRGINYYKLEYRNITDKDWILIEEMTLNNNDVYPARFSFKNPITERGIYEVKMTVKSPEGIETYTTKQFTVLELRLDAELEPSIIYASQSYKIKATVSKDSAGLVAKDHNGNWITLEKVSEDSSNKYYEKEITTLDTLTDGDYTIEVYAIYPFNNEVKKDLNLVVNTPITVNLILNPDREAASETIDIVGITNSKVEPTSVTITVDGEPSFTLTKGTKTGDDIIWTGNFTIPLTKADGEYNVEAKAVLPNGNIGVDIKTLTIVTPINLTPLIPSEISTNSTCDIKATTTKYVDNLYVVLYKGEPFEESISLTGTTNGSNKNWSRSYAVPEDIPEGIYTAEFTARTSNGNVETKTVSFRVNTLKIYGSLLPTDPMAGDELIFNITTEGYAEKLELILEDDVIINDFREEMGYNPVNYPVIIDLDETQNVVNTEFKYIVWCTTPQSLTLKGERLRPPYTFKVRAWKGNIYKDIEFTTEIQGDIRQLIKFGISGND